MISEPDHGSVRDESGHIWTRFPNDDGDGDGRHWVCFHYVGNDPPEEIWWDWQDILADAEGELETL